MLKTFKHKTPEELLMWEQLKTTTLQEKLKNSEIERGMLQSDFDEFKEELGHKKKANILVEKKQLMRLNSKLKKDNAKLLELIIKYNISKIEK